MTLDELIAQTTNPQEFARLCNSVFSDIYGNSFQVIDGTRGDDGNDGYVASERRMLAIYCPVKPEQKTDASYLKKIRSDLQKCATLKRGGRYEVDAWTFITPRKLANNVISEMRALGCEVAIRVSHQESTFLANELYRRGHLLKGFPNLQQLDLGEKIDRLAQALADRRATQEVASNELPTERPEIIDHVGDARLRELMAQLPNQEYKSELKSMAYMTTDPVLEINAILALFQWFDPSDDDRSEFLAFASRAIDRARRAGQSDAEAIFHAHKAALLLWDFNTSVVEAHYRAAADILLPFAITPVEQSQQQLTRLRSLEDGWKAETAAALDLVRQSHDSEAVANVLVVLGTNMGQLAQTHRLLDHKDGANRFLGECKTLLMAAKDSYADAGDELGATNAVFNLANQLRWHDAKAEAIVLVKSTISVAERHGDLRLLQKARWLEHTLETGEIPNYADGERREWTLKPPHQI
jgi:hypothetical protein